jgi:altronate dehydratase small subunit
LYRKKPLTARGEVAKLELSITLIIYTYPIEQGGGMIMAGEIQAGADALVMDTKDHVATALKDLAAGDAIQYRLGQELCQQAILEAIPFGHKVAIVDIGAGVEVRKYGEVIGRSTVPIAAGQHVHVHNIEGIRGRGDQAKPIGVSR